MTELRRIRIGDIIDMLGMDSKLDDFPIPFLV
jgi:hypothetical protein